jgi:hypothetical protein
MGQNFEERAKPLNVATDLPERSSFLELKLNLCDPNRIPLGDDQVVKVVKNVLTRAGLFGSEFLYSAFSPAALDTVKQLGTYRTNHDGSPKKKVFCNELNGNVIGYKNETLVEAVVARGDNRRGIGFFIVYDRAKLDPARISSHGEFVFREPNNKKAAILAIVEVKF